MSYGVAGKSTPGLSDCARVIYGRDIQGGGIPSPVEDAQATMDLFLHSCEFDPKTKETKRKGVSDDKRGDGDDNQEGEAQAGG